MQTKQQLLADAERFLRESGGDGKKLIIVVNDDMFVAQRVKFPDGVPALSEGINSLEINGDGSATLNGQPMRTELAPPSSKFEGWELPRNSPHWYPRGCAPVADAPRGIRRFLGFLKRLVGRERREVVICTDISRSMCCTDFTK